MLNLTSVTNVVCICITYSIPDSRNRVLPYPGFSDAPHHVTSDPLESFLGFLFLTDGFCVGLVGREIGIELGMAFGFFFLEFLFFTDGFGVGFQLGMELGFKLGAELVARTK